MLPSDPDALIIGAGAAGIAAARGLLARGKSCVILEASDRVGGRAFTTDALGPPADLGATWLHLANDNPLTAFADRLGFERLDHDTVRQRRLHLGDRFATGREMEEFEAADDAFEKVILRAAAEPGPDRSVADVMPRGGFWDASVAHWQGAQISAAEVEKLSLRDYAGSLLGGPNLRLRAGIGTLVQRIADGLPVKTGAKVARLRWAGPGVLAEGDFGTLRAKAAVVTVSTGVLAAGGLVFDPALPATHRDAAANLPLGLLTKLLFRATSEDRLDIPPFASLRRRVTRPGDRPISFIGWVFGEPILECFVGGALAWELCRAGAAATEAHVRSELVRLYGARAQAAIGPAVISAWGSDPNFLGSYTHARPGHAEARRILAEPLADGRLCFAGEACDVRLAGTLAGAWNSGERAAAALAV